MPLFGNPESLNSGNTLLIRWRRTQANQTFNQRSGRSQVYYSGNTLILRWAGFNSLTGGAAFVGGGTTSVSFAGPRIAFQSDGATTVAWVVTTNTTAFQSDGATALSFTGQSAPQFIGTGSTTVSFRASVGNRFRSDGHTDVQFFVTDGQLIQCLVGGGVVDTSSATPTPNAVH